MFHRKASEVESWSFAKKAHLQEVAQSNVKGCTNYTPQQLQGFNCSTFNLYKGQLLYLPKGVIHYARANEDSIHVTLSIPQEGHTWVQLLESSCVHKYSEITCRMLTSYLEDYSKTPEGYSWTRRLPSKDTTELQVQLSRKLDDAQAWWQRGSGGLAGRLRDGHNIVQAFATPSLFLQSAARSCLSQLSLLFSVYSRQRRLISKSCSCDHLCGCDSKCGCDKNWGLGSCGKQWSASSLSSNSDLF